MEARQTLRDSAVPKGLIAVVAIGFTIGLAGIAASLALGNTGSSSAGVKSVVHAAPGTVLRQDNPVQTAPITIVRHANPGRRGGTQIQDDSGFVASDDQTNADLTRVLPVQSGGTDARGERHGTQQL